MPYRGLTSALSLLCVDDEPDLLEIFKEDLSPVFGEVVTASSGTEALDILRKRQIDAVLTDFRLPGLNGIQLIEIIRADWPFLPVVMLTGNPNDPAVIDQIKRGNFEVVEKPFRSEVVIKSIQTVIMASLLTELAWNHMTENMTADQQTLFLKQSPQEQYSQLLALAMALQTRRRQGMAG